MPWVPLAVRPDIWVDNKPLGKDGYAVVNIELRQVDYSYIFPTKHQAYGKCGRRNKMIGHLFDGEVNENL